MCERSGRANAVISEKQNNNHAIKKRTAQVARIEAFFREIGSKIKVVKTDDRKPPKVTTIGFIIRF